MNANFESHVTGKGIRVLHGVDIMTIWQYSLTTLPQILLLPVVVKFQEAGGCVEVEPATYVRSLIAMSLLFPDEIISEFHLISGLYNTLVRNLRIMSDPLVLSRFILGDCPGTYQRRKSRWVPLLNIFETL